MNRIIFLAGVIALLCSQMLQAKEPVFLLGAGGFDVCVKKERLYAWSDQCDWQQHKYITEVLKDKAPDVNSVSIWITRNWQEHWYPVSAVQKEIIDKGYTPIFIFYWFADDISPAYVQKNQQAYFADLKRFQRYLKKLKGKSYVILNPEFNEFGVGQWKDFNQLLNKSIAIIKQIKTVQVGFCPGDFGNYFLLEDEQNWNGFAPAIEQAIKNSDFIAFQEMRALSRNSAEEILLTPFRALRFSQWLYKKYKKPTFLAYLAVSSYGSRGSSIQASVLQNFALLIAKMKKQAHLIGFNVFHFIDTPAQQGYFGKAEKHFGLIDQKGREKPALFWFKQLKAK